MLRTILQGRAVLALLVAAVVGTWGLHAFPVPTDNPFLALIAARRPHVFAVLSYGYATMWFTTPYLMASIVASLVTIVVFRTMPSVAYRPLPAYPEPEERPAPTLVLGETHEIAAPGRSPEPTWLTIPQRGLYTGIMILGAVGTGKTSACMYPYVDQLLRWRAADPDLKMGGLVLEVKGDFCRQVRTILARAGRESDYVEVGLNSGVCYNPLHNDLDPYAVSYAVATLLNNLFGRSKEPFWQQAYTDLLKFVISLRRITDGYTTLAEVYRYIIDDKLIDKNIRALQAQFKDSRHRRVLEAREPRLHAVPKEFQERGMGSRALSKHRHGLRAVDRREEVIHVGVVDVRESIALGGLVDSSREVAPHSEPVVVVTGFSDIAEVAPTREGLSGVVFCD